MSASRKENLLLKAAQRFIIDPTYKILTVGCEGRIDTSIHTSTHTQYTYTHTYTRTYFWVTGNYKKLFPQKPFEACRLQRGRLTWPRALKAVLGSIVDLQFGSHSDLGALSSASPHSPPSFLPDTPAGHVCITNGCHACHSMYVRFFWLFSESVLSQISNLNHVT